MEAETLSEQDLCRFRVNFGTRLGAYVIDVLILWILMGFVIVPVLTSMLTDANDVLEGLEDAGNADTVASGVVSMFSFVWLMFAKIYTLVGLLCATYFMVFEGLFGVSVGKLALGIKIAHQNSVDKGKLMVRAAFKSSPFLVMVMGFGAFWATHSIPFLFASFGILGLANLFVVVSQFIALGESRQSLYDKMTQTAVYKKTDIGTLHEKLMV